MATCRNAMVTYQGTKQPEFGEHVKYAIWQLEKAPSTGKLHMQAYVEVNKVMRYKALAAECGWDGAHVEKRMGSQKEACDYCAKTDSRIEGPWEYGQLTRQGARVDLEAAIELAKGGAKREELIEACGATWARNWRALDEVSSLYAKSRDWPMEVSIIWGPSGSGKTRYVHEKESSLYVKDEGKWWDGYDGQEAILFDDVDWAQMGLWMSHTKWLQAMDRYPFKVEVKGGYREFRAKRIYITSMYNPEHWMKRDGVERRVTSVTKLGG